MHAHRTRLAAAAAFLALAAPLSTVTVPAEAGQQHRSISIRGVEPRENRFFIKGRVAPSYENRAAVVQRKVGRHGRWKAWDHFRTNNQSRYRQRVKALRRTGRVYYRVKVDASGGFATSFSRSVYIRTYRA